MLSHRITQAALLAVTIVLAGFFCVSAQSSVEKPEGRYLHHVAYDEGNQQILLYGGNGGYKLFGDLWAWKGNAWKKLSESGPPDRSQASFGYDAARKVTVLFGGSGSNNQPLDDTWEWNGTEWKQNMSKGPSARNHAMTAFDQKSKSTLFFGGVGTSGLLSDTWAFDGTSWKQLNADGPKDCLPHGMLYNEVKQKIILVTLSVIRDPKDEGHARNDLWEWTGDSWKKLPDDASITTSSNLQALAPFGKDGIVLFDGSDVANGNGKTFSFLQDRWASTSLTGPPAPRFGHGMAYDKSRGVTVLFGGGNNTGFLKDVWEWDGKVWKEVK